VLTLHARFVDSISETALGYDIEWRNTFLYGLWQFVFWGSIGAVLHASNLRRKRSATALREGELERLRSERRLAEAQLDALHAQVEPEFVLSTLGTVERLYVRDPAAADRVLDALIQFLREATPLLRRQVSTIGHEGRLVQAYVRTLGAATGASGRDGIEVDERADSTPLAPGLLLTLAQVLLGALRPGTGNADFDVHASSTAARTIIDVSVVGVEVDESVLAASLDRIRHRLVVSCGPSTTLEIVCSLAQRHTLRLTLIDQSEEDGT
jgi:LytS/YehU family sensor histidine kinase